MVIAIAFIGIMGPSITNVIISLCITKWAEYARITRGLVQIERHAEYITFARMSGASTYEFYGATSCRMYYHRW